MRPLPRFSRPSPPTAAPSRPIPARPLPRPRPVWSRRAKVPMTDQLTILVTTTAAPADRAYFDPEKTLVNVLTTPECEQRVRERLMVLLAINSGATDAIGFLCLGGAF